MSFRGSVKESEKKTLYDMDLHDETTVAGNIKVISHFPEVLFKFFGHGIRSVSQ